METFGTLFCGLGLFIIGVRFLSQNLKQITGRQFKKLMSQLTRNRLVAALIGFLSGTFTQSGNASVFIATSLNAAGLITTNRSLTIINWANIGTSVLIFMVAINLKLFALYLLGLIGFLYYLKMDRQQRFNLMIQVFLGLGLLFLGIHFMKTGAKAMESSEWMKELLHISASSVILLFLAGSVITFIIQSSSAVSVVAISLASAGLLNSDQTIIIVLGTGIGSAANIILLSGSFTGTSRQLALYQSMFKASGSLIVSIVIFILWYANQRSANFFHTIPVAQQVAYTYLMMVVLPTFFSAFLNKPITRLLSGLSPPLSQELLCSPHFLYEGALEDPVTALNLIEKEQLRLLRYLPDYLTQVSAEKPAEPSAAFPLMSEGFRKVAGEVSRYLSELSLKPESPIFHEKILFYQSINYNLISLESSVFDFSETVMQSYKEMMTQKLAINLIESLRAITDTFVEGFESNQKSDFEITLQLTNDRGELLKNIRQQNILADKEISILLRQTIYTMTLLFERIIWLLRSITQQKIRESLN